MTQIFLPGVEPAIASAKRHRSISVGYGRYQFVREGAIRYDTLVQICNSKDAIDAILPYHKDRGETFQEHFCILTLDTKHRPIKFHPITIGSLDCTVTHPREIFKPAILDSAAAVILTHNHPSGDPNPSREDIRITERMDKAGEILGIRVLDHIVVGDGTWKAISIRDL